MGHTVLGKTVTDNFKTKKRRKAKPEELMIFKNTHDAIIDEETYVSYRKPRAVSTEQRERARQMMIELNKEKED